MKLLRAAPPGTGSTVTVAVTVFTINVGSRPRAAPRRRFRDELDTPALSIAVTALRTRINPNVEAGANLARRIPVSVCVRFAAGNDPVRAAVSVL